MSQEHPITPPQELIHKWFTKAPDNLPSSYEQYIATQAARWGADQELEACCDSLQELWAPSDLITSLRAARRPKPPRLKEQALALLDKNKTRFAVAEEDVIRLALESLPD